MSKRIRKQPIHQALGKNITCSCTVLSRVMKKLAKGLTSNTVRSISFIKLTTGLQCSYELLIDIVACTSYTIERSLSAYLSICWSLRWTLSFFLYLSYIIGHDWITDINFHGHNYSHSKLSRKKWFSHWGIAFYLAINLPVFCMIHRYFEVNQTSNSGLKNPYWNRRYFLRTLILTDIIFTDIIIHAQAYIVRLM